MKIDREVIKWIIIISLAVAGLAYSYIYNVPDNLAEQAAIWLLENEFHIPDWLVNLVLKRKL